FIVLFLTPFILNAVISPVTPDLLEDPSPRQELPSSNKSLEMNVIEPDLEQSALKIKLSIKNTGDSIFGYGEFFYVENKVDGKLYRLTLDYSVFKNCSAFDNYGKSIPTD